MVGDPGLPGLLGLPGLIGLLGLPELPELLGLLGLPELPGLLGLPGLPGELCCRFILPGTWRDSLLSEAVIAAPEMFSLFILAGI